MADIVLTRPWTLQPQIAVQVNWANPLTKGLVFLSYGPWINPIIPVGSVATRTAFSAKASVAGISAAYNGSSVEQTFDKSATGSSPAEATLFALCATDVTGTEGTALNQSGVSGTPIFRIGVSTGTTWRFQIRDDGSDISSLAGATITTGKLASVVGVYRSGTGTKAIYVDGVIGGTTTGSGAAITLTKVSLGSRVSSAYFQGVIPVSAIWNRALSESEIRSLYANPWQLFAPLPRTIWAAAGGTNTPVDPGVGNIVITGYAPTVDQTRSATPGVGNIVITGYAPTVDQTRSAEPGVGNITITGYAPTVTQASASQNIAPDVGAIIITGYAPTVTQAPVVQQGSSGWVEWKHPKEKKKKKRDETIEIVSKDLLEGEVVARVPDGAHVGSPLLPRILRRAKIGGTVAETVAEMRVEDDIENEDEELIILLLR